MAGCGGKNTEKTGTGCTPDLAIPFNVFPLISWAGVSLPPPTDSPLFSTVTLPQDLTFVTSSSSSSGTSFQGDQPEDSHCQSFWKLGQSEVVGVDLVVTSESVLSLHQASPCCPLSIHGSAPLDVEAVKRQYV